MITDATLTHVAAILQVKAATSSPKRAAELKRMAEELLAEARSLDSQTCPCGKCVLGILP